MKYPLCLLLACMLCLPGLVTATDADEELVLSWVWLAVDQSDESPKHLAELTCASSEFAQTTGAAFASHGELIEARTAAPFSAQYSPVPGDSAVHIITHWGGGTAVGYEFTVSERAGTRCVRNVGGPHDLTHVIAQTTTN